MIDSYLKGESEIEDHVIHLLFSANRWEAVYVYLFTIFFYFTVLVPYSLLPLTPPITP